jgi:hypothetical protein
MNEPKQKQYPDPKKIIPNPQNWMEGLIDIEVRRNRVKGKETQKWREEETQEKGKERDTKIHMWSM